MWLKVAVKSPSISFRPSDCETGKQSYVEAKARLLIRGLSVHLLSISECLLSSTKAKQKVSCIFGNPGRTRPGSGWNWSVKGFILTWL